MTYKHETLLSRVARLKFGANPQNTLYTIGPEGTDRYAGIPDYPYNTLMIIKDASILWTHGKAHHFDATQTEIETITTQLATALAQVEQATTDARRAKDAALDASHRAEIAETAAREASAATAAIKAALEQLSVDGDTESIIAQVLTNTAEIAAIKERLDNLPAGGSDTNVALEYDQDEGDIYLVTGTDSRIIDGELTDDGDVELELNII